MKKVLSSGLCAIVFACALAGLTGCSDDVNEPGKKQDDMLSDLGLSLTITAPAAADTAVGPDDSVLVIAGSIADSSNIGIASILVNNQDVTDDFDEDNGSFSTTVSLDPSLDTMQFIVALLDNNDNLWADTLDVFRDYPVAKKGMAKLSGTLYRENSGAAVSKRALRKVRGVNAAGEAREVDEAIPATGADVMAYDADSLSSSTASVAQTQTDSLGNWSLEMAPGSYFIFFVYFDRENLELVTGALQNVEAKENQEIATDTATAITDDIKPMMMGFLDAANANDDGLYVAGDIVEGMSISISFSEAMTRASAGDSVSGVVLGRADADKSSMLDTIPVDKFWGPSGRELRLKPLGALDTSALYKVIIPATLKDLALNKLDQAYSGMFRVCARELLPPFTVVARTVSDSQVIEPGMLIEVMFSRPVDVLSLNKQFSLEPAANAFFEGKGPSAKLVSSSPWARGEMYTLTVPTAVKDLLGDTLEKPSVLHFTISEPDSFETKEGAQGAVAAWIKSVMGAYISGDIETFSRAFHPQFESIGSYVDHEGVEHVSRQNREAFLAERKAEAEAMQYLKSVGVIRPRMYEIQGSAYIKLTAESSSVYMKDIGEQDLLFETPEILVIDDGDTAVITTAEFSDNTVTVNGVVYTFRPADTFIGDNAMEESPEVYGKLLVEETDVDTQLYKMDVEQWTEIKHVKMSSDTSADAVFKMTDIVTSYRNDKAYSDTAIMAIQMQCVKENGIWRVIALNGSEVYNSGDNEDGRVDPNDIDESLFDPQELAKTAGIDLLTPAQLAVNVSDTAMLSWTRPDIGNLRGYLVAVSNEISGGFSGLLVYTQAETLTIMSNGEVIGGTVLTIDPGQLMVPLPGFGSRLDTLRPEDAYVWKVVGLPDSVATSISAGEPLQVLADSDFGNRGMKMGIFTLGDVMPDLTEIMHGPRPDEGDFFGDRDGDMVPDMMEMAYGTDPDDPGSWPNFAVDSDLDGYPDFMEIFDGSDPEDKASVVVDEDGNFIADALEDESRAEWNERFAADDDGDGVPTEIEFLFGTDPWDPNSKPKPIVKGAAPAGTYHGIFSIETSQDQFRLTVTLYEDSGKAMATIDSSELKTMAINRRVPLRFEFGEWTFRYPITSGPNEGKSLKFRLKPFVNHDGAKAVEGPVDILDPGMDGGPYLGRFFASTSGDIDPGMQPAPSPMPGQHTGALPLPPPELFDAPDSLRMPISLTFSVSTDGDVTDALLLTAEGEELQADFIYWQPGAWPAMKCEFPLDDGFVNMPGDLFQAGDTLFLAGPVDVEENGMMQHFDFVLHKTGMTSPDNPEGEWHGFLIEQHMKDQMPMGGPLPFIGTSDTVAAALARTDSTGMMERDSSTAAITRAYRDNNMGGMWFVETSDGSILVILEDPQDQPHGILFGESNGALAIMLRDESLGGATPMPMGPAPFDGSLSTIESALAASDRQVMVMEPDNPQGYVATVNDARIEQFTDPMNPEMMSWVIEDYADPAIWYIFFGDPTDFSQLQLDNGMPVVGRLEQAPGSHHDDTLMPGDTTMPGDTIVPGDSTGWQGGYEPPPYHGAESALVNALQSAQNEVWLFEGSLDAMSATTVDPATLKDIYPPEFNGQPAWIGQEYASSGDVVFLGDSGDQSLPLILDERLVVAWFDNTHPGDSGAGALEPFTGALADLEAALDASSNIATMHDPHSTSWFDVSIDRQTLHGEQPADMNGETIYVAADAADPALAYVFLGDPADPTQPLLRAGKPEVIATRDNSGTQPGDSAMPADSTQPGPFTGIQSDIVDALAASENAILRHDPASGNLIQDQVDAASLTTETYPEFAQPVYVAALYNDPSKLVIFMGTSDDSAMLMIQDGKPVAVPPPPQQ